MKARLVILAASLVALFVAGVPTGSASGSRVDSNPAIRSVIAQVVKSNGVAGNLVRPTPRVSFRPVAF